MAHFTTPFVALLGTILFAGCAAGIEESVRPGVNKTFLDPKLEPTKLQKRFEGESREIFAHRHRIAAAARIGEDTAVADIGAGTGLFLDLFAKRVGPGGKVYAVDISPKLIEFMTKRISEKRLEQVEPVLCTERSAELKAGTVDLAFVCDTYHHFEYPRSTIGSIRNALRPKGRLIIVDFERLPGTSRKWVLNHVRAGKAEVIREIASMGFRLVGETKIKGLRENYMVEFVRD
jgi:SAM-dependent methyltransferase